MFRLTSRAGLASTIGIAVVVAFVALAGASASGATRASGLPYVYTDKSGDNASAPDIQKVVLTDQGNGLVGVEIDLAAMLPADGSGIVFLVDADSNQSTGDSFGMDYAVAADDTGIWMNKWNGSDWQPFNHQPANASMVGGRLSFALTLSDFGTTKFGFVVLSYHGDDEDAAPEVGDFSYPDAAAQPSISAIVVSASALAPKAGATFTVPKPQLRLSTGDMVAPDSVTYTLTYKGQRVKPVRAGAWKLPKSYKGKHLSLTVNAVYQGLTDTVTLPVVPR